MVTATDSTVNAVNQNEESRIRLYLKGRIRASSLSGEGNNVSSSGAGRGWYECAPAFAAATNGIINEKGIRILLRRC